MLSTVLGAHLPIVVTILLGFIAAWHHDFDEKQAATLNRMVLLCAVPMGLFAGTVSIRRDVLPMNSSKPDKQWITYFNQPHMVGIESPHPVLRVSRGKGTAQGPGQLPLVFDSIGS